MPWDVGVLVPIGFSDDIQVFLFMDAEPHTIGLHSNMFSFSYPVHDEQDGFPHTNVFGFA